MTVRWQIKNLTLIRSEKSSTVFTRIDCFIFPWRKCKHGLFLELTYAELPFASSISEYFLITCLAPLFKTYWVCVHLGFISVFDLWFSACVISLPLVLSKFLLDFPIICHLWIIRYIHVLWFSIVQVEKIKVFLFLHLFLNFTLPLKY